jgi:NAD-dependent dihydropyrimidine dehydrogenase PreA subunit
MGEDVYRRLAKVLDTLPQGFPATDSGVELRILEKIFTPEEADLFCDLRLTPESAEEVAERTGRPLEGLGEQLTNMWRRGEIWGFEHEGVKTFKMAPWVIGIYEFQLERMDREFAEMCKEYSMYFGPQFIEHGPAIMHTVPIEKEIPTSHEALPYERVSSIIESGKSFVLNDCICKKEEGLLDKPCAKPLDICLAIGTEEGGFESAPYVCNCCGCCCGVLQAVNLLGSSLHVNSTHYAEVDPDLCTACGICADERCQVNALDEVDGAYRVNRERCIGCGLCATTCPTEAVRLVAKNAEEVVPPPQDDNAWLEERARQRGVDFSAYK